MPAAIEHVSIGTELLLGDTVDGNVAFAGKAFAGIGLRVTRRSTVADSIGEIQDAVGAAIDRTGAVLVCGGLGPTNDDLTRDAVAGLLGLPLEFDEDVWHELADRWRRHGREISDSNRVQAMVPRGAEVLPNKRGSAPGLWIDSPRGLVVLLPGVPLEFEGLLLEEVIPRLRQRLDLAPIRSRILRTTAIAESRLGELLGPLEAELSPITLAYLPDQHGVDLRLTAWQLGESEAQERLDSAEASIRKVVGEWVYASDDRDLAQVVIDELRAAGETLATAESCTGGLLGARITSVPGCSDVYIGGIVSYSNRLKEQLLGVASDTLLRHGAVSEEAVREMALGAARSTGAVRAVAITGIAGPDGGTDLKPVGTVWIGWYERGQITARRFGFAGDRSQVRERAAQAALRGMLDG